MTNPEFSNTFDTLLNSYNAQAQFGEQSSKIDIALDEYEKSVLLTQAQDIIVKSYFDARLNPQGQGFDDSQRRQIDFSSLIKVATLYPKEAKEIKANVMYSNSKVGEFRVSNKTTENIPIFIGIANMQGTSFTIQDEEISFPLTESVKVAYLTIGDSDVETLIILFRSAASGSVSTHIDEALSKWAGIHLVGDLINLTYESSSSTPSSLPPMGDTTVLDSILPAQSEGRFDDRGIIYNMPTTPTGATDVLFILNEKLTFKDGDKEQTFVIVPLNYKEYDRLMTKPYAQPLKKQAWRIFQNQSTGFDLQSELIPRHNILGSTDKYVYKIRYVKRPSPIILEDLGDLDIDGVSTPSSCELNPIIHMDILTKAVELAITTRGGRQVQQPARNNE